VVPPIFQVRACVDAAGQPAARRSALPPYGSRIAARTCSLLPVNARLRSALLGAATLRAVRAEISGVSFIRSSPGGLQPTAALSADAVPDYSFPSSMLVMSGHCP